MSRLAFDSGPNSLCILALGPAQQPFFDPVPFKMR
jgi:hypothetical protein